MIGVNGIVLFAKNGYHVSQAFESPSNLNMVATSPTGSSSQKGMVYYALSMLCGVGVGVVVGLLIVILDQLVV